MRRNIAGIKRQKWENGLTFGCKDRKHRGNKRIAEILLRGWCYMDFPTASVVLKVWFQIPNSCLQSQQISEFLLGKLYPNKKFYESRSSVSKLYGVLLCARHSWVLTFYYAYCDAILARWQFQTVYPRVGRLQPLFQTCALSECIISARCQFQTATIARWASPRVNRAGPVYVTNPYAPVHMGKRCPWLEGHSIPRVDFYNFHAYLQVMCNSTYIVQKAVGV